MPAFLESFFHEFYRNIIAENRWKMILQGLGVTVEIAFFSILIGTVIGIVMCLMRISKNRLLQGIAGAYIGIIRGTPMVTQLLLIYFGVFAAADVSKIFIAVVAFSINSGAYVAEIFRSGIQGVDIGQTEAGRSLGLSRWQTMRRIVMPQAFKNILPTYTNEFIVLIKETAIVGYIAIEDLTKVGDIIRSRTFSAFFPLITVAVLYLLLTSILAFIFSRLERRMRRSDRG